MFFPLNQRRRPRNCEREWIRGHFHPYLKGVPPGPDPVDPLIVSKTSRSLCFKAILRFRGNAATDGTVALTVNKDPRYPLFFIFCSSGGFLR